MPPNDKLDSVERLDALLGSLRTAELVPASQPGDETLEPLLVAARALRPLRQATPAMAFTRSLEARLLAEDALLAASEAGAALPVERATPAEMTGAAVGDRTIAQWPKRQRQPRRVRIFWPAIAAVLLLAMGTLSVAAAAAGPGSPLYALRRLEQTARVAIASSPADQVNLHLQYASDALAAANAAARSGDAAGYRDALATVRSEIGAATSELRNVAAGSQKDSLAASLASLRTRAIANLRTDLPLLSWSQRLTTTDALAAFGDVVPHIVAVTSTRVSDSGAATGDDSGGSHTWRVQIAGTGFAPGVRLLVNGQPAGTVLSATDTALVATYTAPDGRPPMELGIANLDDTAVQVTAGTRGTPETPMSSGTPGTSGRPAETGTPGSGQGGDHGNTGNGGHSGPGGHDATPTPTPHDG